MSDAPTIPFGYKAVEPGTPLQKGDGVWDGARFRKARKEYPLATAERPAIRKCAVTQPVIPQTWDEEG